MDNLITPAAAEELILANLPRLDVEAVPMTGAAGRILAAPLLADRALPPYDRVMMDGICFRAADARSAAGRLPIAGLHPAGAPTPGPLPEGSCWEIMTGAVLPPDCDTIVRYEDVNCEGGHAHIDPALAIPGKHLHAAGSDFSPGDQLVPAGTRLGSREIAVAATVGATDVPVVAAPRIRIITTGDELVPPGEIPAAHQVRQSNNHSLQAALAVWGSTDPVMLHVPDDEAAHTAAFESALATSDLVLICGGISRGKRDFVRPVLEKLLGAPAFHGVAQRPGKPLAFWEGPPPVFALPGNPMAVLVCFHRYVLPALAAMSRTPWQRRRVTLTSQVDFAPPFAYFLPVSLDGHHQAEPTPTANSGDFATAITSDGFIELPGDHDGFPPGTSVAYQPWL